MLNQRHGADVVSRIVAHAARRPAAVALLQAADRVTYAELDAWSSAVAADLLRNDVSAGDAVAVLSPRGAEAIVGQLAAMRIGAWYVAVDPAQSPERRSALISGCDSAAVLGTARTAALAPPGRPFVPLTRRRHPSLPPVVAPELAAYACFTSGSTGEPKGIVVPRGALASFAVAAAARWEIGPATVVAGCCPLDWDGSVIDTWVSLAAGACALGPAADQTTDPAAIVRLVTGGGAEVMFLPTALGEVVLESPQLVAAPRLRTFIVGGDRLTARPPANARFQMWNIYGPTETTVAATWERVEAAGGEIAIGRPVPGATVEIVDEALRPVRAGQVGEIMIGGAGVALGYLGQPRLTAESYLPAPGGARRYRTGDYGSQDLTARTFFVGRRDRQASVHGRRIELDGVRAALLRQPAVTDAAVEVLGEGDRAELVAFVVADTAIDQPALRASLAGVLAHHQLPDRIVALEAVPAGPDGRPDRGALAARARAALIATGPDRREGQAGPDRPRDALEQQVLALWEELLGCQAGMRDNFFGAGGNSVLAARLVQRVQTRFEVELRLADFFAAPTARALSGLVRRAREASDGDRRSGPDRQLQVGP